MRKSHLERLSFYAQATVKWGTGTLGNKAPPALFSLEVTASERLVSWKGLKSQFAEVSVNFLAKDLRVYHGIQEFFIAPTLNYS